jgi:hypothetical protein
MFALKAHVILLLHNTRGVKILVHNKTKSENSALTSFRINHSFTNHLKKPARISYILNVSAFWVMMRNSLVDRYQCVGEHTASISRVYYEGEYDNFIF